VNYDFPDLGGKVIVPLKSRDAREKFLLDLHRGRIDLHKVTFQNRARVVYVLARLDIAGPTHRNPDGEEIPCPHLHVYREGFAHKWAIPLPSDKFSVTGSSWELLQEFLAFCNILDNDIIQPTVFT
jgi:hypothetical protein